jgi:ABC-type transport system involved in multi-copper enzyme maturation permease subunit
MRVLTPARISLWLLLALFPVMLIGLVRMQLDSFPDQPSEEFNFLGFSIVLFALIAQVVLVLGLLLWASPAINAELEAQTWIYAAVRPWGRVSLILGKYLVAVLWTGSAAVLAAALSVPLTRIAESTAVLWTLLRLIALGSPAYGALYLAIGTLSQKRPMVISLVYTLIVEVVLSLVPAAINQFSVSFRLRSLMAHWQGIDKLLEQRVQDTAFIFDAGSTGTHIGMLMLYTVSLLSVAIWRASSGEYSLQSEA